MGYNIRKSEPNRLLSGGRTDATLWWRTFMRVASCSVVFTFSLCNNWTTGSSLSLTATHQTGKTLVGSGNTDIGIDFNELILGRVDVHLFPSQPCSTTHLHMARLIKRTIEQRQKTLPISTRNKQNLVTDIRSGVHRIQIHLLVERLVIVRVEQSKSLRVTRIDSTRNLFRFHRFQAGSFQNANQLHLFVSRRLHNHCISSVRHDQ